MDEVNAARHAYDSAVPAPTAGHVR